MSSRPIVEVWLDGVKLAPGKAPDVTVEEPDGSGSSTATVKFAGPSVVLDADTHLVVKFGYASGLMDTLFDSTELLENTYTIDPRSDTVTGTWGSGLDAKRRRAPLRVEFWDGRGKTLRDFVRFIGGRCGYAKVRTNVPRLRMPARVPILPKDGYWTMLSNILDPLRPQILPDDIGGVLSVWWLDAPIPGAPLALPDQKGEGITIPKVVRERANVALLKYQLGGNDGGALTFDCAPLGATFVDPSGRGAVLTSAACAVEIDPEANAEIVERVSYEPAPPPDGDTGALTRLRRTDRFAVVRGPDGAVLGDPILTKRTTTAYATDGVVELGAVHETETTYTFVRGTNYQQSAGHRSATRGYESLPLVGRQWVDDLYSEREVIEYLYYPDTGDFLKYRSTKQAMGRVLEPDHVPLYEAGTNGAIRVSAADTYQWTVSAQPLFWEIEELSPLGGSVGYARRKYNYLTRLWEGPGDEGDSPGALPKSSDIAPRTIEETYPEPSLGGVEPAEGWQVPVEIDGTWIGTGVLVERGQDPLTARSWCVLMANAMFRRAGHRVAKYSATYAKYLSKVRRGASVTVTRRLGANPHPAVVTGCTFRAEWAEPVDNTAKGGYTVSTSLTAQRVEQDDA